MRIVTQIHNHSNELLITHDVNNPQFHAYGHSGPFKAEGPQIDFKVLGNGQDQVIASNMSQTEAYSMWFALTRALFPNETVGKIYDLSKGAQTIK